MNVYSLDIYYLAYFFIAVFAASFALPTGAILIIVSFAAVAEDWRDLLLIFFLTFFAAISGDYSAYLLARYFNKQISATLLKIRWLKNKENKINKLYDKYGAHTVFFTRFFFSGIGPYVNYFSGWQAMPARIFLKAVVFGELIYALLFVLTGCLFSNAWQEVIFIIQDYLAFALLALLAIAVIYRMLKLIINK